MKKILFLLLGTNKGGNILSTISICKKINKDNFKTSILLISPEKKIEKYFCFKNLGDM